MERTNTTNQGWIIYDTITDNRNNTHVVVLRPNASKTLGQFAWGSYYNSEVGSWAQGHYDFAEHKDALNDMLEYLKESGLL